MKTMKIKKGDTVHPVGQGPRQARPRHRSAPEKRVLVENLNMIKRHTRPRPMANPSRMGQQQLSREA